MNVELIIHGVLSSGQATSEPNDKDYYKQFYSEQKDDVLMTVEVVERSHGVSTFYNYLRNNNVISAREGSYFGMTVRIDGAFYKDIKNMYNVLDNFFNKMIVGTILKEGNSKLEFIVDDFCSGETKMYVKQVQEKFLNIFALSTAPNDFIEVSPQSLSQNKVYHINPYDLQPFAAVEAFSKRIKIYVSPFYPLKQLEYFQKLISKTKEEAEEKILAAEKAHEKSVEKHKAESVSNSKKMKDLQVAMQKLKTENTELSSQISRFRKDSEILTAINSVRKPISDLAGLCQSRFQDGGTTNTEILNSKDKKRKKGNLDKISIAIGLLALNIFLCLLTLLAVSWDKKDSQQNSQQNSDAVVQSGDGTKKKTSNQDFSTTSYSVPSTSTEGNVDSSEGQTYDEALETDVKYSSALWINIGGLNQKTDPLEKNKTYTLSVKNGEFPQDGSWQILEGESSKFLTNGESEFQVSRETESGTRITILYLDQNGNIVVQRTGLIVK